MIKKLSLFFVLLLCGSVNLMGMMGASKKMLAARLKDKALIKAKSEKDQEHVPPAVVDPVVIENAMQRENLVQKPLKRKKRNMHKGELVQEVEKPKMTLAEIAKQIELQKEMRQLLKESIALMTVEQMQKHKDAVNKQYDSLFQESLDFSFKNEIIEYLKSIDERIKQVNQENINLAPVDVVPPVDHQEPPVDLLGNDNNNKYTIGSKVAIASWASALWFAGRAVYKEHALLSKETNVAEVSKRVPKTAAKKFRAVVRSAVKAGKFGLTVLAQTSKAIYAKPKKYKKLLGSTGFAAVVTAAVVASK